MCDLGLSEEPFLRPPTNLISTEAKFLNLRTNGDTFAAMGLNAEQTSCRDNMK
jgi:hypothetical protein